MQSAMEEDIREQNLEILYTLKKHDKNVQCKLCSRVHGLLRLSDAPGLIYLLHEDKQGICKTDHQHRIQTCVSPLNVSTNQIPKLIQCHLNISLVLFSALVRGFGPGKNTTNSSPKKQMKQQRTNRKHKRGKSSQTLTLQYDVQLRIVHL